MTTIKLAEQPHKGTYEVYRDAAGTITKIVAVMYDFRGEVRRTVGRGTSRFYAVVKAAA